MPGRAMRGSANLSDCSQQPRRCGVPKPIEKS
jgi:hypothetical protein